jgi:hypothetical protein
MVLPRDWRQRPAMMDGAPNQLIFQLFLAKLDSHNKARGKIPALLGEVMAAEGETVKKRGAGAK